MGRLDNAAKILLRGSPETAAALAFPGRELRSVRAEDAETPREPSRGDKLLRVELAGESGPRWLHVEVQSTWESDVPRRVHSYWTGFHQAHRDVSSLVVILQRGNKKGQPCGTYEVDVKGRRRLWFSFDVVNAWEIDAGELVGSGVPELLPLVPFASGAEIEHAEAAFLTLSRLRAGRKRADLQSALASFAGYVFRGSDWLDTIPSEVRMKSTFLVAIERENYRMILTDQLMAKLGSGAERFVSRFEKASARKLKAASIVIATTTSKKALVKALDELLP
jgi:hypothetical protein